MKIVIDTNAYTDLQTKNPPAVLRQAISNAEEVIVPIVVWAELRSGFMLGTRLLENEETFQRFLSLPGTFVAPIDEKIADNFCRLLVRLRKQGTPIQTHDVWIAATAMHYQAAVLSRDHGFNHLPELTRITWKYPL